MVNVYVTVYYTIRNILRTYTVLRTLHFAILCYTTHVYYITYAILYYVGYTTYVDLAMLHYITYDILDYAMLYYGIPHYGGAMERFAGTNI